MVVNQLCSIPMLEWVIKLGRGAVLTWQGGFQVGTGLCSPGPGSRHYMLDSTLLLPVVTCRRETRVTDSSQKPPGSISLGSLEEHKDPVRDISLLRWQDVAAQHAGMWDGTRMLFRAGDRIISSISMQYCSAGAVSMLKWGMGCDVILQVYTDMTFSHIRSCFHLFI